MFVIEAVLSSEQITEHRLTTFLKINDKFSSKVNTFSYIIL